MDIQFNSWLPKYKQPFGAVKTQSEVTFQIELNGDEKIHDVSLLINKDSETSQEFKMDKQNDNQYSYVFDMNQGRGLYYYCFKVYAENNGHHYVLYYGKNQFSGSGRQYCHFEEIDWYQLTCYEQEDNGPKWYQEAVFYQIFPDRFRNGNKDNKVNYPKKNTFIYGTQTDKPMYIRNEDGSINRWDFFGGNLLGIKEKIPYFKELGITALYLNPIFEATSNHRYDTNDYFKIDPMLGTNEEFRELVDELHKNDIRIILDGVFSHVGKDSKYFNYSRNYGENEGAYQTKESQYFDWFTFHEYPNNYESWWGITDLPEVNKWHPDFQQFIYGNEGVLDFWHSFGIDGWRIDVADEFPNFFLSGLRDRLETFKDNVLIGEVWEDASNKVAYGEDKQYATNRDLHGVMNYPFKEIILDLVNQNHSLVHLGSQLLNIIENYPMFFLNNALNNIGTHDTKRLLTECYDSVDRVKLAFTILFVLPGVPCIYYGDEVGVTGGADPENRAFYPWLDGNESLKETCQELIQLRRNQSALVNGTCHILIDEENHLLGILRKDKTNQFLSIFNFTDDDKPFKKENWFGLDMEKAEVDNLLNQFSYPDIVVKNKAIFFQNNI